MTLGSINQRPPAASQQLFRICIISCLFFPGINFCSLFVTWQLTKDERSDSDGEEEQESSPTEEEEVYRHKAVNELTAAAKDKNGCLDRLQQ